MQISELAAICAANELALSDAQLQLLERYATLLKETNQKINLISRKDEDNILGRHILHSLTIAMPSVTGVTFAEGGLIFDIGTGGGLPGIPLKIVRPDLRMILCDSVSKKIVAVQNIVDALELKDVRAVAHRAEVLAQRTIHQRQYDAVISRAVAQLDDLLGWTKVLLKQGAPLLSLKGGDLSEEIKRSKQLKFVKDIEERPLALRGYDNFVTDEKKVVVVHTKSNS